MASTGAISDYAALELLDHVMADGTFGAVSAVYLALETTVPTTADTGSSISEPNATWTNYARVQLVSGSFDAAASRQKNYSGVVDFGTATCSADVTLKGWAICDNATTNAGNAMWVGTTDGDVIVQNGNPVSVTAGNLDIKFSNVLAAVS